MGYQNDTSLLISKFKKCFRNIIMISAEDHGVASNSNTGPRFNIKTVLSTYGDFHVKDKTAVRTSDL